MNAAAQRQLACLIAWAAIAVCGVSLAAVCAASEPWGEIRTQPQNMVGTLSCSAATCHGGSGPRYWSGSLAGAEYVHWLGNSGSYSDGRRHYDPRAVLTATDGDPHALAGQRISSARFQEVLKRASQRPDGTVDRAMFERCARCHDPSGIDHAEVIGQVLSTEYSVPGSEQLSGASPVPKADTPDPRQGRGYPVSQRERVKGIGCETCHGGAKQWIAVHYQRDEDRTRLFELGMLDTKNLLVRARLCAGCHVGSAENDMNHDMIAAGHPPLRFELASYEALIPRKHWDDRPARRSDPSYEVQLWAVGRIASAEAALALLEGRAKRSADAEPAPWPEFAESNCLACHQPLRSLAGGSSRASYRGIPAWQSWNTSLADVLAVQKPTTDELLPVAFPAALARVRMGMDKSWQPAAAEVAQLAAAARQSLVVAAQFNSQGRLLDGRGRAIDIRTALEAASETSASASWDDLCVRVSLLAAARRAISDASGDSLAGEAQGLKAIAVSLRFVSPDRQWPPALADSGTMNSIGGELESIRKNLLRLAPESRVSLP